MRISSLRNPRVKRVVKLRTRRGRDREQGVLIEGYRGLVRALASGYPVSELYICEELFQGENEAALIDAYRSRGTEVIATTAPVFRKMAYRDRPEGLLGVGPQQHASLANIELPAVPLVLVAESIEKPGNLGTMLRSADATGVAVLIVCDPCTDVFNPNVVRASTGNLFTIPVAEATSEEALEWLRHHGVRTLAASPHASRRYTEVDMTGPLAVVVGTEQVGLSQWWMERADMTVRIPMLGEADSLNVALAAGLLLYEAVRQRFAAGMIADPGPADDSGRRLDTGE